MAKRMFFKLLWGFGIVILIVIIISIPVGIFLSHVISKPYLNVFQNLSNIAQLRLKLDQSLELNDNELTILQKYLNLLIVDLK